MKVLYHNIYITNDNYFYSINEAVLCLLLKFKTKTSICMELKSGDSRIFANNKLNLKSKRRRAMNLTA